ncbi:hypothetical protein AB0I84_06225, partial [Streptomyces spectabilis]|uniref:hypothetical protein n=1 Tax=Streptomyces spectabilis TaxID=68270 RepID=UPI0033DC434F
GEPHPTPPAPGAPPPAPGSRPPPAPPPGAGGAGGPPHGSDPGTAPYRNASIIRELLGREVHPADEPTAFQEFAV